MKLSSLLRPVYLTKRLAHSYYELRHPDEPWITRGAIEFCRNTLSKDFIGLEWGSGRSTLWFAHRMSHLTSVEHDESWFRQISSKISELGATNISYLYRPLGHPESVVIPFEERLTSSYVAVADTFANDSLDFVVVDGHYREACIEAALPKLKAGGFLLLDNSNWLPLSEWKVTENWEIVHQSSTVDNQTTIWRKTSEPVSRPLQNSEKLAMQHSGRNPAFGQNGKRTIVEDELSIIIPTYRRTSILVDTLLHLLQLEPKALEIIVIDQTPPDQKTNETALHTLALTGKIRLIQVERPSITGAMNLGLVEARSEIVLFLDDDIIPHPNLVAAHLSAHKSGHNIVAGQVLQPGERPQSPTDESVPFRFASTKKQLITELMAGNFSIKRRLALSIGGFDENFAHVAYRFESEFAQRALAAGSTIFFEPKASIKHLKAKEGGTRSYGHHLTTVRPSHSVGAYYFLFRSKNVSRRLLSVAMHPFRAIRTKHHAKHPWWIPATLVAEALGFAWAVFLYVRGPRLLNKSTND